MKMKSVDLFFVELYKGKFRLCKPHGRTDILVLQVEGFCNVFIEHDMDMIIQCYDEVKLEEKTEEALKKYIKGLLDRGAMREHIEHEKKFFAARPWEQLDGLTPKEAVAKLTELGF
jgi:hypothetical protein